MANLPRCISSPNQFLVLLIDSLGQREVSATSEPQTEAQGDLLNVEWTGRAVTADGCDPIMNPSGKEKKWLFRGAFPFCDRTNDFNSETRHSLHNIAHEIAESIERGFGI
jgi:hypothetical protein